jgi:hypothetical protein
MQRVCRYATPLLAVLAALACKPKGAGSGLNSISDDGGPGGRSAITLAAVRNFTSVHLPTGSANERQVAGMVGTRLFWEIECVPVKTKSGAVIPGDELAALVDARALIDDLYLDANRYLFTSANDNHLVQPGDANSEKVMIPCHIYGDHALTSDTLTDLMLKAAGMPATLPSNPSAQDGLSRVFFPAQTLFLATRAPSNGADTTRVKLQQMLEMLRDQRGVDISHYDFGSRQGGADSVYNPCVAGGGPLSWAAQWKGLGFSCPSGNTASSFVVRQGLTNLPSGSYRPCSDSSAISCVRDLLAVSVASSFEAVYGTQGRSNLDSLWRILTSATPWSQQGVIGNFLATGAGANVSAEFPAAPSLTVVQQQAVSPQAAAPLLLSVTAGVYSANSPTGIAALEPVVSTDADGRSSAGLLGGQPLLAGALPSTAGARADQTMAPSAVKAALQESASIRAQIPSM